MAAPWWKATARKNVEAQTEVPKQDASVQVAVCSECQSPGIQVEHEREKIEHEGGRVSPVLGASSL